MILAGKVSAACLLGLIAPRKCPFSQCRELHTRIDVELVVELGDQSSNITTAVEEEETDLAKIGAGDQVLHAWALCIASNNSSCTVVLFFRRVYCIHRPTGTDVRLCDGRNERDDASQSLACTSVAKVRCMCGGGGIMYIYMCVYMPAWCPKLVHVIAFKDATHMSPNHRKLDDLRRNGTLPWAKSDGKSQVP